MTSSLEPSDVGPAVGGDLAATQADRDHVVTLLTAAHAEGLLSADERDQRIAAARAAATFDDLVPLTRDLVSLQGPIRQGVHRPVVDETNANPNADLVVTIFGGTERRGAWRARRNISVLTLFGGTEIDLTEAIFEAPTVTVNVFCLFGGVDVVVSPGTEVRNEALAVFGGTGTRKIAPPVPGAPTVLVRGFVGFGGVEVKHPKMKG